MPKTRDIESSIAAIETNIEWIKDWMEKADQKFAPFWIKYPVYASTAAILMWTVNQLLDLIPKAAAFVSYLVTIG